MGRYSEGLDICPSILGGERTNSSTLYLVARLCSTRLGLARPSIWVDRSPVREQNDPSMLLPVPPRGCAQDRTSCSIVHLPAYTRTHMYRTRTLTGKGNSRSRTLTHTHTYVRRYVFTCIGNQRQRRRTDERDGQTLFTGSNAGQNKIETRVRWNDRFQEDKPPEASATRFAGPVAMDHIGP